MPNLKSVTLLLLTTVLFIIAGILFIKIKNVYKGQVKGIQYTTKIDNKNLIFGQNTKLKYFYEPKPNSEVIDTTEWLNKKIKNTINSDSLNERFEYSINKSNTTYRIVVIGDSFTYGQYVNTEYNYTELLEDILNQKLFCQKLNRFDVINLGMGGYDIEFIVERLKNRGIKYKPDLILWLLLDKDFNRLRELTVPLEKKFIDEGYLFNNPKTGLYEAAFQAEKDVLKARTPKQIIDYQTKALLRMENLNINKLLIFSFPSIDKKIENIIEDFVKLNPKYKYSTNISDIPNISKYKLLDGHPNEQGHQKIAESIYSYLTKNYFKDCQSKTKITNSD